MIGTTSKTPPAAAAALALLTVFGSLGCAGPARAAAAGSAPRRLTIQVYEHEQTTPTVVVAVPLALATAALRFASHTGARVVISDDADGGCGAHRLDTEALLRAIEESGPGTLIEVREHDQRVTIRLE